MTELELLKPVFAAEVLVLDDLGAQKPTNGLGHRRPHPEHRYNDKLSTIITTNYPDLPAVVAQDGCERAAREPPRRPYRRRMLSRLAEMCIRIEMTARTSADRRETRPFG